MLVVFRMSAIVTALAVTVACGAALTGCGNRGPLYLPTVPPLPPKPAIETDQAPDGAASKPEAASSPDADSASNAEARGPLTLAPAGELAASTPRAKSPSPASGGSSSSSTPNQ